MSNYRPLSEHFYQVKVSYIHTRSLEDVKIRGNRQSGVDFLDKNINFEPVTVYISIDKMFEYYKNGVSMVLVRREDSVEIYTKIQNYLHYAAGVMEQYHFSDGEDPVELAELDRFASDIYNNNIRKVFVADLKVPPKEKLNRSFGLPIRSGFSVPKSKTSPFSIKDRGERPSYEREFISHARRMSRDG